MDKICAVDFFKRLNKALKDDEANATKAYCNSTSWTDYLSDITQHILEDGYNLKTNREYLRIDMIGWSGYDKWGTSVDQNVGHMKYTLTSENNPGLNEFNWNLEIAIEFENDPNDWMDEVIKLSHIKCGLKVVIGYTYYEDRETKDSNKLNFVAKHMNTLKYGKIGENENFMIILGNCGKESKEYESIKEDIDFRPYIFNGKVFEKLDIS